MLLASLDRLQQDPLAWAVLMALIAAAVVTAVTVHEFSHAWCALRLGDRTAARQGRVTLNPMAHLDLSGSLLFLIVGFGWGKPTPVDPYAMRIAPRMGMAITSLAGPAGNVATALLLGIPFRLGLVSWNTPGARLGLDGNVSELAAALLAYAILFNVFLAVFNLIPLPPLDGFSVALGVLPGGAARALAALRRYGAGPLMLLLFLELFTPVGVFSSVLLPLSSLLGQVVVGHPLR